ncbi:MAG TPA: ABC transporter permease [Nocardioides sp.]|uniref:ABC transporter permease n=1 Tax=Nocardioides sp. TaxID=35761 RepID=UPI002D7E29CE|nr:ABC transporter permease [Nocardioides sp.]HET6654489.1 ABC transporter permease [Nocardioides sp.]
MSAAVTAPIRPLDLSGTPSVPMSRLIGVELRKMADTRAGKWLLIAIGLITAAAVVIFFFAAPDDDRVFLNFMGITATPQGFLLPVLGILLVCSEWTQRTALVTFTLTPIRSRVIVAKIAAALVFGAAAIVLAVLVAALATLLAGAPDPWQNIGWDSIGKFTILQASGVLQGLAFGLLFLNTAAAIVTFFVVPIAFNVVASIWTAMRDIQPWVDLGFSQQPLFLGGDMSGEQWAQLAVGTLIWVVLPVVVGFWRVLRAEVK